MDYKKLYEEALERAKKIHNEHKAQPFNAMTKVFPELAESEDEKIRKALIEMFISIGKRDFRDIPTKKIIAWLEKQGKQPIYKTPSREIILAIWDLGNEWKELTKGSISTEYGTQLDYIQYFTGTATKQSMVGYFYTTVEGCIKYLMSIEKKEDLAKNDNKTKV